VSTLLTIILSWSAGVLCVLLLLIFRINPEDHDMQTDDRLRDMDGKPLYVPFQTPIMMPIDLQLECKRKRAIAWLGTRWILHPQHSARKQS
jgi:hypothetical protein